MSDYKANANDLTKEQLGTIINIQNEIEKSLRAQLTEAEKLLKRFVPDERVIQWEQRELDARDYFKNKELGK